MIGHVPHNGTATSKAAAASVTLTARQTDRRKICEYIARMGAQGCTDDEIARALPSVGPNSLRPRRGELVEFGLVSNYLGEMRATASGRQAVVYHITKRGLELLGLDPVTNWCADRGRA